CFVNFCEECGGLLRADADDTQIKYLRGTIAVLAVCSPARMRTSQEEPSLWTSSTFTCVPVCTINTLPSAKSSDNPRSSFAASSFCCSFKVVSSVGSETILHEP